MYERPDSVQVSAASSQHRLTAAPACCVAISAVSTNTPEPTVPPTPMHTRSNKLNTRCFTAATSRSASSAQITCVAPPHPEKSRPTPRRPGVLTSGSNQPGI